MNVAFAGGLGEERPDGADAVEDGAEPLRAGEEGAALEPEQGREGRCQGEPDSQPQRRASSQPERGPGAALAQPQGKLRRCSLTIALLPADEAGEEP